MVTNPKLRCAHFAFTLGALPLLLSPLRAQVVVSQVYGGGGNSGATYKNDFIELLNRGNTSATLDGWSVQYASSTGSSWQVTNLSGSIQPGQYYLIQEAAGTGGTQNLPPPDATGNIAMSATAGKVALVNATAALSGTCPTAGVQDFIGYGSATNCSEGSPMGNLSNTTAALRNSNGCTDTNNNLADFTIGNPNPRNTGSPFNLCAGGPLTITTSSPLPDGVVLQPYSVTFAASGGSGHGYVFSLVSGMLPPGLMLTSPTLSGTPTTTNGSPFAFTIQVTDDGQNTVSKDFQLAIDPVPPCNITYTIPQIQGNGNASPLAGMTVTTSGIVTGLQYNGFFLQAPPPGDNDSTTSDGIFVYTSSAPPVSAAVGNAICVAGKVAEYIPSSDPYSPSQTEIDSPAISTLSTGNALPPAVVLSAARYQPGRAAARTRKV